MYQPLRVRHLAVLHKLSNLLALWPPASCYKNGRRSKLFTIFGAAVLGCYLAVYGFAVNEIFTSAALHLSTTSNAIQLISYTVMTISSIHAILQSCFVNTKEFHELVYLVNKAESMVQLKSRTLQLVRYYLELIAVNCYLTLLFTIDSLVWGKIKGLSITFFATNASYYLQIYGLWISLLLIHNYSSIIKQYMARLNESLSEIVQSQTPWDDEEPCFGIILHKPTLQTIQKVRVASDLKQTFTHLCRMYESFNAVFGWRIVFIFGVTLVRTCEITNILTVLLTGSGGSPSPGIPYSMVVTVCLWVFSLVVSKYLLLLKYISNITFYMGIAHNIYTTQIEICTTNDCKQTRKPMIYGLSTQVRCESNN